MREQRRIYLPTPPRRWTAGEIRMLGRYPDRELARRLRLPTKQIRDERIRLHIAPFRPLKFKYWTTAELWLVGRHRDEGHRDEEVAMRTGHTAKAVLQKRLALGLPMPKSRIYRWNPEHDKLLGTRPDGEVAALLECNVTSVEQRRRKLRIPPVRPPRHPRPNDWKPEDIRLIGTAPDGEIARGLGRTVTAVTVRRSRKSGRGVLDVLGSALWRAAEEPKPAAEKAIPKVKS